MARVLDHSVEEAAALLWASEGLLRKRRIREGVLRASVAGMRALVALGWPLSVTAIGKARMARWRSSEFWDRADSGGWKPAAQLTLTGWPPRYGASVHVQSQAQEIAQSHLAVGRSQYWWKR
jgi:hypothetical protein